MGKIDGDYNSIENIKKRLGEKYIIRDFGYLCIIFLGILSILYFLEGIFVSGFIYSIITFLLCGFVKKITEKEQKDMNYILKILVNGEYSIQKIADEMAMSYDEAYEEINKLISKNIIFGYTIDKKEKKIIGANNHNKFFYNNSVDTNSDERLSMKCRYCGANSFKEINNQRVCKYCGSIN